jgi:hypothetical protein
MKGLSFFEMKRRRLFLSAQIFFNTYSPLYFLTGDFLLLDLLEIIVWCILFSLFIFEFPLLLTLRAIKVGQKDIQTIVGETPTVEMQRAESFLKKDANSFKDDVFVDSPQGLPYDVFADNAIIKEEKHLNVVKNISMKGSKPLEDFLLENPEIWDKKIILEQEAIVNYSYFSQILLKTLRHLRTLANEAGLVDSKKPVRIIYNKKSKEKNKEIFISTIAKNQNEPFRLNIKKKPVYIYRKKKDSANSKQILTNIVNNQPQPKKGFGQNTRGMSKIETEKKKYNREYLKLKDLKDEERLSYFDSTKGIENLEPIFKLKEDPYEDSDVRYGPKEDFIEDEDEDEDEYDYSNSRNTNIASFLQKPFKPENPQYFEHFSPEVRYLLRKMNIDGAFLTPFKNHEIFDTEIRSLETYLTLLRSFALFLRQPEFKLAYLMHYPNRLYLQRWDIAGEVKCRIVGNLGYSIFTKLPFSKNIIRIAENLDNDSSSIQDVLFPLQNYYTQELDRAIAKDHHDNTNIFRVEQYINENISEGEQAAFKETLLLALRKKMVTIQKTIDENEKPFLIEGLKYLKENGGPYNSFIFSKPKKIGVKGFKKQVKEFKKTFNQVVAKQKIFDQDVEIPRDYYSIFDAFTEHESEYVYIYDYINWVFEKFDLEDPSYRVNSEDPLSVVKSEETVKKPILRNFPNWRGIEQGFEAIDPAFVLKHREAAMYFRGMGKKWLNSLDKYPYEYPSIGTRTVLGLTQPIIDQKEDIYILTNFRLPKQAVLILFCLGSAFFLGNYIPQWLPWLKRRVFEYFQLPRNYPWIIHVRPEENKARLYMSLSSSSVEDFFVSATKYLVTYPNRRILSLGDFLVYKGKVQLNHLRFWFLQRQGKLALIKEDIPDFIVNCFDAIVGFFTWIVFYVPNYFIMMVFMYFWNIFKIPVKYFPLFLDLCESGEFQKRQFLLVGPSGCGKTFLPKALAGEFKLNLFAVHASTFVKEITVSDQFEQLFGSYFGQFKTLKTSLISKNLVTIFFDRELGQGWRQSIFVFEGIEMVNRLRVESFIDVEDDFGYIFYRHMILKMKGKAFGTSGVSSSRNSLVIGTTLSLNHFDPRGLHEFGSIVYLTLPSFSKRLQVVKSYFDDLVTPKFNWEYQSANIANILRGESLAYIHMVSSFIRIRMLNEKINLEQLVFSKEITKTNLYNFPNISILFSELRKLWGFLGLSTGARKRQVLPNSVSFRPWNEFEEKEDDTDISDDINVVLFKQSQLKLASKRLLYPINIYHKSVNSKGRNIYMLAGLPQKYPIEDLTNEIAVTVIGSVDKGTVVSSEEPMVEPNTAAIVGEPVLKSNGIELVARVLQPGNLPSLPVPEGCKYMFDFNQKCREF